MEWYWFVIIGVVLAAIMNIVQRKILSSHGRHKMEPYIYTILVLVASAVIVFIYRQITHGYVIPNITLAPINIGINLIVSTAGTLLMFEALKRLEVSRYIVVSSFRPLFTVLAAFLFLGTIPTSSQIIGGAFIIAGTLVIYLRKHRWNQYKKGVYYALASSALLGATLVNDKYLLAHYEVLDLMPFVWVCSVVILLIIRPKILPQLSTALTKENLGPFLTSSILAAGTTVCIMIGLQLANQPASVSMLQQLQTLLVVLLGIVILQERESLARKLIATPIASAGVAMIIMN